MCLCFEVFAAVYELTAGCFGEEEFGVVAECFFRVECLLIGNESEFWGVSGRTWGMGFTSSWQTEPQPCLWQRIPW